MSKLGNKYKIGIFAVAAFAILVLGLVSLGTFKYFRKTYSFMTAVASSIQGLEKGAKVKIKGVTIGSVEKLQLGPDMKLIYIYMKFDPEAFSRVSTAKNDLLGLDEAETLHLFSSRIREFVSQGMRCQLQYGDITGTLFIDIAYVAPSDAPPEDFVLPKDHPPYIPAVPPVTIGSIISDVQKATRNIARIDIDKISCDIETILDKANKLMDEKEIKTILEKINSISGNIDQLTLRVNEVFDKERMETMGRNIETSLNNFNSTLVSIEKLSEEARLEIKDSKLPETSEKARSLMENAEESVKKLSSLRGELKRSMEDLSLTLTSARDLLDSIEKNPNALIYGKAGAPLVPPE